MFSRKIYQNGSFPFEFRAGGHEAIIKNDGAGTVLIEESLDQGANYTAIDLALAQTGSWNEGFTTGNSQLLSKAPNSARATQVTVVGATVFPVIVLIQPTGAAS